MLNRKEIEFALSIVQKGVRTKKKSVLSDRFKSQWNVGRYVLKKKQYTYGLDDIDLIKSLLIRSGVDSSKEVVFGGSRTDTAKYIVDEKHGAVPIFTQPVCFKVLQTGVFINDIPSYLTGKGHLTHDINNISTVKARSIVMVENLETFVNLDDLIFEFDTNCILFIWRGSVESKISIPNTQKTVQKISMENKIPMGYLGDYDLKGLIIGLELKGQFLILPKINELIDNKIQGSEKDYSNQWEEYNTKKDSIPTVSSFISYFDYLHEKKQSFTQERMCALNVTHELIEVTYSGR
jgi:hypothetical protein